MLGSLIGPLRLTDKDPAVFLCCDKDINLSGTAGGWKPPEKQWFLQRAEARRKVGR